ncbi:hypothetical protein JCM6882_009303 [Rhodosporidiobolus microsporus]
MAPAALPTFYDNPLPFSFFASLVDHIAAVAAKKKGVTRCKDEQSREQKLLQAWVARVKEQHGRELPEGTVVLFFRLFFPEEGVRRRYGLQEKTLADLLETLFKVKNRGRFSRCWALPTPGSVSESSGCLGEEVRRWMEKHGKGKGKGGELTLGRVDQFLDELAALSTYSADDVRQLRHAPSYRSRSTLSILNDLLTPLTPSETSLVIQLLLRDLSPLLYPAPSCSGDVALERYNSTAYDRVKVLDAMRAWHGGMERLYLAVADLDWCAWQVEEAIRLDRRLPPAIPRVGLPVKIPKTEKPGSCSRATKALSGQVAVETKYDGERLQIHIDLALLPHEQIRIFSKSGRDSTQTRHLLLPIIRASLSLPLDPLSSTIHPLLYSRLLASPLPPSLFPPTKLILEGEMVPYDETRQCIDEFWKLDCAKTGAEEPAPLPFVGSAGGKGARRREEEESHETGMTGATTPSPRQGSGPSPLAKGGEGGKGPGLHLMVVWFDLLLVEDESLLDEPYELRRARLESLVRPIEGFSALSASLTINFDHPPSALSTLRLRFAQIIVKRCEGLMLKPVGSTYNDGRRGQRWVKLKKDFIPGAGDTLDFHVVGASWQKQRGRELLVPPSVWTTFFVGLRADDLGPLPSRSSKPHFHMLFSASYGLSRAQLAKLCHDVREARPERWEYDAREMERTVWREVERGRRRGGMVVYEAACTSFTFSLAPHLRSAGARPSIIFRDARVMELNGAGFQRTAGSPYYELRFPRITKPSRTDGAPLSLADLQRTAEEAMHAAPTDVQTLVAAMWRRPSWAAGGGGGKEGESKEEKERREVREWVRRLERADGVLDRPGGGDGENEEVSGVKRARRASSPAGLQLDLGVAAASSSTSTKLPIVAAPPASTSPTRAPPPDSSPPPRPQPRLPLLPTTPPRAASQPMGRSVSSPCARSDAPSPPSQRRALALVTAVTEPDLGAGARAAKRSRVSGLSTTTTRRRESVLSLSSSTLAAFRPSSPFSSTLSSPASSRPSSPAPPASASFSWSIYPPPPPPSSPTDLPTPRHPALDASNFLASPLSVLWVAGFSPPSLSAAGGRFAGRKKQGFVFVAAGEEERACVEWLQREARGGGSEGARERALVWIVRIEALERVSDFTLAGGRDVLSVLS